ncbi:MAG: flagellin FliC [Nitrospinae bacterium]|nr:flagellin FliC [Nitrospinota bacterium]
MPVPISNNTTGTLNKISQTQQSLGSSLSKLSSGQRITKAADDAAGLAISEKLGAQNASIEQAIKNISAGGAMARTAEGGIGQISELLTRGRELAVQSANGTLSAQQRQTLNTEFSSIKSEIDRITQTTEFNGQKLLTGDLGPNAANPVTIQAGTGNTPADRIALNGVQAMDVATLGISSSAIDTPANALASLQTIDAAMQATSQNRAAVGAIGNRLTSAAQNLSVTNENLMAADSQIRGLDYASEVSKTATANVALRAGISALKEGLKSNERAIGSLLNLKG